MQWAAEPRNPELSLQFNRDARGLTCCKGKAELWLFGPFRIRIAHPFYAIESLRIGKVASMLMGCLCEKRLVLSGTSVAHFPAFSSLG